MNLKLFLLPILFFLPIMSSIPETLPAKDVKNFPAKTEEKISEKYIPFAVDKEKGIQLVPKDAVEKWKTSKRVALVVGVSNYPYESGLSRLSFGASDSQKMAAVLKQVGMYDEVVLLNDELGSQDKKYLPNRENILKEFSRLLSLHPRTFLFYFSGHGFEFNNENQITPIDTIMSKDKEKPKNTINIAQEIIEKAKQENVEQMMVFLDACRETLRIGKAGSGEHFAELPERIQKAKGVGILIGTNPGGYSYESGELGGGVFTHFIVKGIAGEVQNRGGEYVTYNDLKNYIETEMHSYAKSKGKEKEQIPYSKGDYTGDFLIAASRPNSGLSIETVQYRSKAGDRVDAKIIYDTKGRKIRLSFHTIKDDGDILPAHLDGISHMVYTYNENCFSPSPPTPLPKGEGRDERFDEDCFKAMQYDKQGNLDFVHGVRFLPGRGWEVRRGYREEPNTRGALLDPKAEGGILYQKLEYDFNGNPILNEYLGEYDRDKDTGSFKEQLLVDKEGISRIVQNFDLLSNKTLEEYYDVNRKLKPNEQGIARTLFSYDSIGNKIAKLYMNEKGNVAKDRFGISLESHAYDYSLNPFGILLQKNNFDSTIRGLAEGEDGLARLEYKYDENCLKKIIANRKEDKLGGLIKEDAKNLLCVAEINYRGQDGDYKGDSQKIAIQKFEYDVEGRLISESYFRDNQKPRNIKEGISKIEYKYNEDCQVHATANKCRSIDSDCLKKEELVNTCVNETHTYNSAGKLEADEYGIAVYKYNYNMECLRRVPNKKHCIALTDTLDIEKKPTLYKKERTVTLYSEDCLRAGKDYKDCKTLEEYYGADGKLKGDSHGIARYIYQYDERGNKTLQETYGTDGKLKNYSLGIAREVYHYNEKGNKILEEYYGSDGKLKAHHDYEIARYVYQYDEKGNKTLEEYYGEDGKFRENYFGIARTIYQYNRLGNKTLAETYGADGKLKGDRKGIVRKVYQYNEKGNKTLEEYYGVDGKLRGDYDGIARTIYQYDSRGNKTLKETYGADEKLKDNWEKIARYVFQYTERGNITLEETYGADGKLKEKYGIAKKVYQYDEKCLQSGNQKEYPSCRTFEEYYGADGKIKANKNGIARTIFHYNDRGNAILREIFGENGKLSSGNIIARTTYQYDEKGKLILLENYEENGKLKDSGIARLIYKYDERENQILEETYGADGKLKDVFGTARHIRQYNYPCLEKGKDHINKNNNCVSYEEQYNSSGIITYAAESTFDSEGNYLETKELTELIGVKKWFLEFNNTGSGTESQSQAAGTSAEPGRGRPTFRFEEKTETISEKHLIKKDNKNEEVTINFNVMTETRYGIRFSSPHPRPLSIPNGTEKGGKDLIIELDKYYRPTKVKFE